MVIGARAVLFGIMSDDAGYIVCSSISLLDAFDQVTILPNGTISSNGCHLIKRYQFDKAATCITHLFEANLFFTTLTQRANALSLAICVLCFNLK